tara:strand:- start:71 stop:829 length:759 start_codon:yes stop_codon:yes gene_type:complete
MIFEKKEYKQTIDEEKNIGTTSNNDAYYGDSMDESYMDAFKETELGNHTIGFYSPYFYWFLGLCHRDKLDLFTVMRFNGVQEYPANTIYGTGVDILYVDADSTEEEKLALFNQLLIGNESRVLLDLDTMKSQTMRKLAFSRSYLNLEKVVEFYKAFDNENLGYDLVLMRVHRPNAPRHFPFRWTRGLMEVVTDVIVLKENISFEEDEDLGESNYKSWFIEKLGLRDMVKAEKSDYEIGIDEEELNEVMEKVI